METDKSGKKTPFQTALPPNALLLGMGMDGLPLVLQLSDWRAGSFLVAADDGRFIDRVFRMMILQAEGNNSRYELCIQLVSSGCQVDSGLIRNKVQPGEKAAEDLLEELIGILRQREDGRLRLPYHLILIEDWVRFSSGLPPAAVQQLLTLVAHGPFWGMWVMAGMTTAQLHKGLYEQVERFPSRVLGKIGEIPLARYFAGLPLANLHGLKENQAVVRAGEDVFSVSLVE